MLSPWNHNKLQTETKGSGRQLVPFNNLLLPTFHRHSVPTSSGFMYPEEGAIPSKHNDTNTLFKGTSCCAVFGPNILRFDIVYGKKNITFFIWLFCTLHIPCCQAETCYLHIKKVCFFINVPRVFKTRRIVAHFKLVDLSF